MLLKSRLLAGLLLCLSALARPAFGAEITVGYLGEAGYHLPLYIGEKEYYSKAQADRVAYLQFFSEQRMFEALQARRLQAIVNINLEHLYSAQARQGGISPLTVVGVIVHRLPYFYVERPGNDKNPTSFAFGLTGWAPVGEYFMLEALRSLGLSKRVTSIEQADKEWIGGSFDKMVEIEKGTISASFLFADLTFQLQAANPDQEFVVIDLAQAEQEFPFSVVAVDGRLDPLETARIKQTVLDDIRASIVLSMDPKQQESNTAILSKKLGLDAQQAERLVEYYSSNSILNVSACFDPEKIKYITTELSDGYLAAHDGINWSIEDCQTPPTR